MEQQEKELIPDNQELIAASQQVFDQIVTREYLHDLSKCEICPPEEGDSKAGISWWKIGKIVKEKDVFFTDKLSMLYMSLHEVAQNVILLLDKKGKCDIDLYLGARDVEGSYQISNQVLKSGLDGFFPGIETEQIDDEEIRDIVFPKFTNDNENPDLEAPTIIEERESNKYIHHVSSVSAIASLRDDKKEEFVQGLERLINATSSIPKFRAYFIADSINDKEIKSMIEAFNNLYTSLSPAESLQLTYNKSESKGISDSFTENFSESIGNSISKTITKTKGSSETDTAGVSVSVNKNYGENVLKSFWTSIVGGNNGSSISISGNYSKAIGWNYSTAEAIQEGLNSQEQKGLSMGKSTNTSDTKGFSRQMTYKNRTVKYYLDILDKQIERLQKGSPFGLWAVATYFVAGDASTAQNLASIYRGSIIGEESGLETCAINSFDRNKSEEIYKYLTRGYHPRFNFNGLSISACSLVTSKELAIHLSFPQSSVPGLIVEERASFARNIATKAAEEDSIEIGDIVHLGKKYEKSKVNLSIEELTKHSFVTGSTGSGKSNTIYWLIDKLLGKNKKFLIVEPTKGDYRKVFGGREGFTVYSTREDEKNLLRINPFAFPDGIRVMEHVERLVEIFGVCWPMYAAMPAVLKNSILSAYEACGWDLRTSACKYGKLYPTVADVVIQLKRIIASSQYSAETKGDYVGALQTRLESLTNGIYSSILSASNKEDFYSNLYDSNAIVDLHHIGSSETRSLLMALVVLGLTEWRMAKHEDGMDSKLQHLTVLEEAHCILPRVSKQQSQEGANMQGKSVEMIASAIAEMRTYGESFIIVDQSPSAVDEAAIRNTNTKIVMNLPDGDDREIAGKAIALSKEEQIAEIARLSTGEAIVWQRGWSEPALTAIHEMTDKFPIDSHNNVEIVLQRIMPSKQFVDYFVLGKEENDKHFIDELKHEVFNADCPSSVKVVLLNALGTDKKPSERVIREAIITYLGLKELMTTMLDSYTEGNAELIPELREYMTKHLNIANNEVQNQLLSESFVWASLQSKKWHSICSENLKYYHK